MTTLISKLTLLIGTIGALFFIDLPTGWIKRGSLPDKYEMGIEKGAGQNGKNAATIKSLEQNIEGFGTLMQNCSAGNYLGKRVKMSGYLKTKDVTKEANFWMRVDVIDTTIAGDSVLINQVSLDNMTGRSIRGTTDWKKYDIVLDVPSNATRISFGCGLTGTGQVWFDNLSFTIVDKSVTITEVGFPGTKGKMSRSGYRSSLPMPVQPINLNFEE